MRLPYEGKYPITQTFGNDLVINGVHIYKQWGLLGHNGIDFGLPTGTSVLAPHNGVIKEALFDAGGYGYYVKIENSKEGSVLGHFQKINVPQGSTVTEGQVVGISDNTGNSTGAHLHWGYYVIPRNRSNGYNGFIDQYNLIKQFIESNPLQVQLDDLQKQYDDLRVKYNTLKSIIADSRKILNQANI